MTLTLQAVEWLLQLSNIETTITSSLRVHPTLDHSRMSPTFESSMFILVSLLDC